MLGFLVMAEQTYVLINYISSFKKKKKNTEIKIVTPGHRGDQLKIIKSLEKNGFLASCSLMGIFFV
jgi:hypothetical protein